MKYIFLERQRRDKEYVFHYTYISITILYLLYNIHILFFAEARSAEDEECICVLYYKYNLVMYIVSN